MIYKWHFAKKKHIYKQKVFKRRFILCTTFDREGHFERITNTRVKQDIESLFLGMTLIRLETKAPKLIIIHFEDKEFSGGQGEQSLIGRSEPKNLFVRVQPGHLLFGNFGHLSALLPVEEDGFQWRRLPVDERKAHAVAERRIGEVRSAAGKLLPLGRLDKTCKERTLSSLHHKAGSANIPFIKKRA